MHLARLVRSTLRPQDALGRTSDHRLAVIFPETDPTQAAQALARLQMALQQRPLLLDEQVLPQSFSAGVIAVQHLEAPQHALERAQAACEQARRMGRARVSIFRHRHAATHHAGRRKGVGSSMGIHRSARSRKYTLA